MKSKSGECLMLYRVEKNDGVKQKGFSFSHFHVILYFVVIS